MAKRSRTQMLFTSAVFSLLASSPLTSEAAEKSSQPKLTPTSTGYAVAAGWEGTPNLARARLAIVPGYTHYNFGMGPDVARVIEAYLEQPTSKATQFTP